MMAHYAVLDDNNFVTQVFVGNDEDDFHSDVTDWEAHYSEATGSTVKRTSFNTRQGAHILGGQPFRGNYAGIGWTYDEELDAFIPPKPSEDATLDETTFSWVVPETEEA
jgi:hypothetical protein